MFDMGLYLYIMKILVTGANGLLGQHLVKLLLDNNYQVIATGKGSRRHLFSDKTDFRYYQIDITNDLELHDVMRTETPDIIIHTAAMTQVDACELNRDECYSINVLGTSNVIRCAELYSRHLIYISTDFVFDGNAGNYKEADALNPVNWYGLTKKQAEEFVQDCKMPWAIARTCLVYGNSLQGNRSNIVNWVKDKLEQHEKIKVVDDQLRTPTYIEDLAKGILLMIEKKVRGIFHISGKDILTPYRMAIQTADFFSLDKSLIEKVNANTFSQVARRPQKTGLLIDKAKKELGYEPVSFDEGLRKMFYDKTTFLK